MARIDGGFSVVFADGTRTLGRRLVLAHGVEDVLADISGVKERWGRTALHCPWRHGYEVGGGPGARLTDGRFVPLKAIFVGAAVRVASPFAETLGCDMTDTPVGRLVKVDTAQQTSQPGVFAAGDLARAASNITLSTSDGLTAGHALFRSLVEEETA
ncbi:MAG: hypothetical protein LCH57_02950 [Proteobacteria bacterium]|nr:hypothetical protein [Pseudomonadota bacterium]